MNKSNFDEYDLIITLKKVWALIVSGPPRIHIMRDCIMGIDGIKARATNQKGTAMWSTPTNWLVPSIQQGLIVWNVTCV
jgi:hypothetical protein